MKSSDVCTIFNRIYDPIFRKYFLQSTIIKGVFWQEALGARLNHEKLYEANEVHIFIPFSAEATRTFGIPEEFEKNPTSYFTLRPEDKIIRGITSGKSLTILSINTFDYGSKDMQHWEVVAK
ncbi:hypothetical protein [Anaerotignum propionicum]|uniref:Uncharacterized protein n=1 Tax=Anaerotignum propionicum DSM 1682 TaxID=991789 RepID=A0A0X8VDR9_ANAPI|nr:hypothetical protein [Anaerotignum propionicum]AMJ41890.1 hypothetical protein CPRO_23230 [Anaerotignum propionicum DSM 1682]SHE95619.1 hypothetical protein SAMN02745151_02334 [[Clostridium] propionicum DSM 1682] [Anaerotignum propionicum DSM 1682]HBF65646.1 hypothetical protein [Clostridium sp.]